MKSESMSQIIRKTRSDSCPYLFNLEAKLCYAAATSCFSIGSLGMLIQVPLTLMALKGLSIAGAVYLVIGTLNLLRMPQEEDDKDRVSSQIDMQISHWPYEEHRRTAA